MHDNKRKISDVWLLVLYDALIYLIGALSFMIFFPGIVTTQTTLSITVQTVLGAVCVFGVRFFLSVYKQIWRYSNMQAYIRLIVSDGIAALLFECVLLLLPMRRITYIRAMCLFAMNLLAAMTVRIVYQYLFQRIRRANCPALFKWVLRVFGRIDVSTAEKLRADRIKTAIIGAGQVGTMLAQELLSNPNANHTPVCFVDRNAAKAGREIFGVPVYAEDKDTEKRLKALGVQEIVFAMGENTDPEQKKTLYTRYKQTGCKIEVYDFPTLQSAEGGKRQLREFDIEELLFRQQVTIVDEKTRSFYRGKTVLITGGGGSIGSELCRQIAKMEPKKLVIVDVYENGAYDVQQELRIAYGQKLNLSVEIITVCDRKALEIVFERYRPQIVLHAAAHKHVPLMEHNVCEAIKNNIFGTLNTVEVAEKYGVKRFMMVSTDKAVNPTNVMGATKHMCEMIVLSHAGKNGMECTATRFGNVLGSAGSVVPLFKRQIAAGGPVTLTDKRIIRYFMTIPEASQLVLTSGAMAKNGELFVLDMGKPVRILELAENMIRLCGFQPYTEIGIVETGLRPGEKLYEELLVKSETLSKTDNDLIFIERNTHFAEVDLTTCLAALQEAADNGDDDRAREIMHQVIPSYVTPESINGKIA